MSDETNVISAESLYEFEQISYNELSPDGRHIAYSVQRVDRETEKKPSDIWVVATDGQSEPHRFTWGKARNLTPKWSPDGSQIAFLSNRTDEKQMQIYVLPFAGGEARPLTEFDGSIGNFAWSPDGTKLVVCFREKDEDAKERDQDEQKKKLGIVAHHITQAYYKADGVGFLPKNQMQVWVVDVADGAARQMTDATFGIGDAVWSPDGKRLAFAVTLHPQADIHREEMQLYTISAEATDTPIQQADFQQITTHEGQLHTPVYSPDGEWIAYLGNENKSDWWQNNDLFLVPANGGESRNLTKASDLDIGSNTINDIGGSTPTRRPLFSADSQHIYFQASRYGRQPLKKISIKSEAITNLIKGDVVGLFDVSEAANTIGYFKGAIDDPGQLAACDLEGENERILTNLNPWLKEVELGEIEELWIENEEGYKIQGWILKPPQFDYSKKYPSILEIHGGPQTQYGRFFMHEFYYLAAQGFVVYFSNPRGGQGYGAKHGKAIYGQWGSVDYQDLMAWADHMEKQPYIDKERMGVTGGSYGGYMTTWIIGHTDRFEAAVAQRNVTNWTSMWGSADFNFGWVKLTGDPHPWENILLNWEHSPIAHLHKATTPTLFIHSLADYRTHFEQTEQAYGVLKVQGIDTELVAFPDESHGLSRGGRTDRRVARLEHIGRWFKKYLSSN